MSYTKRQIIEAAFTEMGMSPYSFELMPEQLNAALIRLDSMMAEWNARGLRLSYNGFNPPGGSTLDSDSGLPDSSWEAVITNLTLRLAPSYGKTVNPDTRITARHALNTILVDAAMPTEMRLATIPAGAGHKNIEQPFIDPDTNYLVVGDDTTLDV
jgi:hypothetical protein